MATKFQQQGATLTEFIVVTPMIILLGMLGVQYTLMYNAKSNLTYASYEAARAGAIHHADPEKIRDGLLKGFLPYLSSNGEGVTNASNIASATIDNTVIFNKAKLTESPFMKIEIISPSKAAFDDFNSPTLQQMLSTTHKVIPNKQTDIENLKTKTGAASGLSIEDANVLKLRITYGYQPEIPLAKNMLSSIYGYLMGPKDNFGLKLLATHRIPVTVDVSAQMLSPAVENGLTTVPYNPGGIADTNTGENTPPDLSTINLPDEYKNLTKEEIIAKIISEGGIDSNGYPGKISGSSMSDKDWLKLLIALGLVGAAASQNDGAFDANGNITNPNVISDFNNPSSPQCSW